ncbi:MAG: hypothetical protein CM1200mP34_5160 [Verrucomicrobiales bacterium]|nr:MAG: hypothetical protein CM1200mP34_5160 [Verrucomicrobiales bacterium]
MLVFTTKDYWLKDFISGIIVISNGNVERGTSFASRTKTSSRCDRDPDHADLLRDLIRNHNITSPTRCC